MGQVSIVLEKLAEIIGSYFTLNMGIAYFFKILEIWLTTT